jgi:hypothetical protein
MANSLSTGLEYDKKFDKEPKILLAAGDLLSAYFAHTL